jgi:hypothetical protein
MTVTGPGTVTRNRDHQQLEIGVKLYPIIGITPRLLAYYLLLLLLLLLLHLIAIQLSCMSDNTIITIISIIVTIIRLHACLFVIHVRLHAHDLLPEAHSYALACTQATSIALKKYAQMQCRCQCTSIQVWLTPPLTVHVREAPG